jgi:hypothetical protein
MAQTCALQTDLEKKKSIWATKGAYSMDYCSYNDNERRRELPCLLHLHPTSIVQCSR